MGQVTFKRFRQLYPNEDRCLQDIFDRVYKDQDICSVCNKPFKYHRLKQIKAFSCQWCGHNLYPTAGTIFHKSSTSLLGWFYAIYLFSVSKNGVSAKELQRHLGVTYKTAWRMAHRIRMLLTDDSPKLSSPVEMDETYIGGKKWLNTRIKSRMSQTPIVGALQRNGRLTASVTGKVNRKLVFDFANKHIAEGAHLLTDGSTVYKLMKRRGYIHETVNHNKDEYVRGLVHTNTIEGFWSQLKRSINGTYHVVSSKYLQTYVDEFSWRYNHRSSSIPAFLLLLSKVGRRVQ